MKNILVTGGAGYIGSHMVYSLIKNGYIPTVIDSFKTSSRKNISTIEKLLNVKINVIEHDLTKPLTQPLKDIKLPKFEAVVHFAALKSVGESVVNPNDYYFNNINSTINVINLMRELEIPKIVFSSTAAVYGNPDSDIVDEDTSTNPISPYGKSKLFCENIIKDATLAYGIKGVILRYFNVCGNLESGEIGNLQTNAENLFSVVIMSHLRLINKDIVVFGNDYKTRDGSGIRDYIHVSDLVDAHLKAFNSDLKDNFSIFNLGTGNGISVLEVINKFEEVTHEKLNYSIGARREGDIAISTTNNSKAKDYLNWEPHYSLEEMISSMWKWYKKYYNNK